MQGERRLLAYDVETGRRLWEKWAPGGMLGNGVPEGRFLPGYRVQDSAVLVQTGTGRRWLLDPATGRCLHDAPTDRAPWPAVTGDGSTPLPWLIQEEEAIVRLNPKTGQAIWSLALPARVLRTGHPVQMHVVGDTLLLLTPTNLGLQLQRVDVNTGRAFWRRLVYLPVARLDLSACSVDERSVYLVRDQTLLALSLGDGELLWEKPLSGPRGTWRTLLVRGQARATEPARSSPDVLLVYPDQVPARSWGFCWLWGSLQWIVRDAPEARPGQGCPIHCCDPASGQLLQRLNLPAGLPRLVPADSRSDPAP
jgi:outer membrane protein assembly factor BamB